MKSAVWSVVTMVREKGEAESMGEAAVREGKAACAQIEGPVVSIYSWQDRIHREQEVRILFKTSAGQAKELMGWIRRNHSYEVPEILAWPAEISDPDYKDWVNKA